MTSESRSSPTGPCKTSSSAMAAVLFALCAPLLQEAAAAILNLSEGDSCRALDGGPGVCTLLRKCRDPGDFRRDHPPICMFKGNEPYICCPPSLSASPPAGSRAKHYCERFNKDCRNSKELLPIEHPVVGGNYSKPRDHKYMALIGYGTEDSKQWGCGGSLISQRYILSAAHCANPTQMGPAKWARLGELDLSTDKDDAKVQERSIVRRIVHPAYKEPLVYNDIALFKLDRDVAYDSWTGTVCLNTEAVLPAGSAATVIGWGRIGFVEATSDQLLEAELDIFNDTDCSSLLPKDGPKTPRGIDSNLMFCAGKRDGSKDACSGDSGGPLVLSTNNTQCLKTQIGITSFGNRCGLPDSPGVYTRVSNYIAWIEDIVYFNETQQ